MELIFALQAAVSEIWADFQNCHIRAWNLASGQSARSCTYTLFLPLGGRNLAYFRSMGSGFRDMGRFLKLPYLGMTLGHWPKLHIYPLSTPGGRNWAYFRSTGSGFWETSRFSKLPYSWYLGMKLGHWPKCHKFYIYFLNYPRVPNFTPFCSMAGRFQDIGKFAFFHWAQY